MIPRKPIKATVIIDVKDFPKSCPECVFYAKSQCIPQGGFSTTSIRNRPTACPLMTPAAYKIYIIEKE
jgi:uncharacterized Fe-S cluster-containing protein